MQTTRRSTAVKLGVTVGLALVLTGCGNDYQGVCVNWVDQTRLDDSDCDETNSGYVGGVHGWYYLPAGSQAPPVGQRATGGLVSTPNDGSSWTRGGVDRSGGGISRGGFGGFGGFGESGG